MQVLKPVSALSEESHSSGPCHHSNPGTFQSLVMFPICYSSAVTSQILPHLRAKPGLWQDPGKCPCIKTDGSGPRLFYAWRVAGPWDVPLSVRWQSPALWLCLGYDKTLECDTVPEGVQALWGMVSMSSGLWQVLTMTRCRLYFCLGFTGHQMPWKTTSLVFRLDLSVSWICGQDGWTNLEGKRVQPDLE